MGLWSTIKGWLNIGGVKIKIENMNQRISRGGSQITGQAVLTSKSDKKVRKMVYKFLLKRTSGSGAEKKTKEFNIAQSVVDQPFEIKPGETKTQDFTITYALEKSLKDLGGVLGAIGKIGAFAAKEKDEYYVVAEADVEGAAFNPSRWVEVTLVP